MINFPAKEIAPCFASSFDFLTKGSLCLIPCAVDQDPYFRLARDKAGLLREPKPVSLYVSLLPDLKGINRKMSASDLSSSIFLTDSPEQISKKIRKYAHSGGRMTLEEHRRLGGDTSIDVSFQYLRYFHKDDLELEKIKVKYEKGEMTSNELKNKCINVIQEFVKEYQERRKKVTDEVYDTFCTAIKK